MSGPDQIWAWARVEDWETNGHCTSRSDFVDELDVEYIRRDPAVLAALPEVQALITGLRLEIGTLTKQRDANALTLEAYRKAQETVLADNKRLSAAIAARDAMIAEAWCAGRDAAAGAIAQNRSPLKIIQLEAIAGLTPPAAIRKRWEG